MIIPETIQNAQPQDRATLYQLSKHNEKLDKQAEIVEKDSDTATQKKTKAAFHSIIDKAAEKSRKLKNKNHHNDGGNNLPLNHPQAEKAATTDHLVTKPQAVDGSRDDVQQPLPNHASTLHTEGKNKRFLEKILTEKNLPELKLINHANGTQRGNKTGSVNSLAQLLTGDSELAGKLTAMNSAKIRNKQGLSGSKSNIAALSLNKGAGKAPLLITDAIFSADKFFREMDAGVSNKKINLDSLLNKTDILTGSIVTENKMPTLPLASTFNVSPAGTSQHATGVYQSMLQQPFGQPGWEHGVGKQIMWLANQNINHAELKLNPANLGSLDVRIEMKKDGVNVVFSSQHGMVRHAIEQSLPQLREMMAQQGLNLGDAGISQHSFSGQQQNAFTQQQAALPAMLSANNQGDNHVPEAPILNGHKILLSDGVDYYI